MGKWSRGSTWRSVAGSYGDDWPLWLRRLRHRRGVYAIRDGSGVLYVGSSPTGRLYATITRHFQEWRGPTAGAVFERDDVEIKVWTYGAEVTAASREQRQAAAGRAWEEGSPEYRVRKEEARRIAALCPSFNLTDRRGCDDDDQARARSAKPKQTGEPEYRSDGDWEDDPFAGLGF